MTTPLNVGFMGTPDFALAALKAIHASPHNVTCVYSQPPRPKGRGHKTIPSPVHTFADTQNIPVFTPLNFKNQDDIDHFTAHNLDVAIVAAYGLILPQQILDAPRFGCMNIHASLLPRWRGAAPIQRAIMAGDSETGIGLMQMEAGLDTGPVIAEKRCPITGETTASALHDTLAAMGADMIVPALDQLAQTQTMLPSTPQTDEGSTYAKMLTKAEGQIDWTHNAAHIDRQIRALNPWPGTWTRLNDKRLKITASVPCEDTHHATPGTMLHKDGRIACGEGSTLRITMLQPEGKKPMDTAAAINGGYLQAGDILS